MRIFSRQIVITLFALLLPLTASAQDDNPFIGVWDLDKPDSNFGSIPVPEDMIRTYANAAGGAFMYLLVTMNADESIGGSSATYRYDNQENTIASLNPDSQATISYRKVNDKTVEYIVRVNDRRGSDSRTLPRRWTDRKTRVSNSLVPPPCGANGPWKSDQTAFD